MKAKEYADDFLNSKVKTKEEISDKVLSIAQSFITEIFDICKARNSTSDSCLIAVIKEQINKWRAFANIVNKRVGFEAIRVEGFRPFILLYMPDLEDHI